MDILKIFSQLCDGYLKKPVTLSKLKPINNSQIPFG